MEADRLPHRVTRIRWHLRKREAITMRNTGKRHGMTMGIARGAILAALPLSLAVTMAGCGATGTSGTVDTGTDTTATTSDREKIANDTDGGHAIEVSGEEKSYSSVDVTKTGEADGDEADFYGENAAVFATEKATLDLSDATVHTNGTHANAVFSYGEGTTVNVSDTTIETEGNCSGGIMVTGGSTLNAENLDIHTKGRSSAAIRSDRGGGTEVVHGGTYKTEGVGSPAIYSTADVMVGDAILESTTSEGVVVEGKNSVTLEDVDLTASNTQSNSDKSDVLKAVMIYQSMSGDATQGEASFSMKGGSLTNKNGDVFFVNNTVATITLDGADIKNEDANGMFLRAAAARWGKEGSNGGHVTLNATNQKIDGNILVDGVSSLNLMLGSGSAFNGAINSDAKAGDVYVELKDGAKWVLTADSHIGSLTCSADSIDLNGHTLYVGDEAYVAGTESTGTAIVTETATAQGEGMPGGNGAPDGQGGQPPMGDGQEPPAKPDGESDGQTPPAKPDGESNGQEPPAKPDGDGTGRTGNKPSGNRPERKSDDTGSSSGTSSPSSPSATGTGNGNDA